QRRDRHQRPAYDFRGRRQAIRRHPDRPEPAVEGAAGADARAARDAPPDHAVRVWAVTEAALNPDTACPRESGACSVYWPRGFSRQAGGYWIADTCALLGPIAGRQPLVAVDPHHKIDDLVRS